MILGIDTGGTYTDAVLFDESAEAGEPRDPARVVAKAKARTSHGDLTIGIGEAVRRIVERPEAIAMVSLSTTLATNALVEGISTRVGVILVGFSSQDVERGGLRDGLNDDPVILAAGGHDSFGNPLAELDIAHIGKAVAKTTVTSFAVSSLFAVRNPEHEIAVRDLLIAMGYTVTCGHELTAKLNGPKRALTCVLNARLIGIVTTLCSATETILEQAGIGAPLMLVRGDGSLVTADFAKARPIETVLSGPAASLIGARWLTGAENAVVADIGGTTTDIAVLRDGEPSLNDQGATVGGHRTMIEAIQMYTYGLGGDSEVSINDRVLPPKIELGPRRVLPLCLLAVDEPDLVHQHLDSRSYPPRDTDCRFYRRGGTPTDDELAPREQQLFDDLGVGWIAADKLISGHLQSQALKALIGRGLVRAAGFTPTDAAHVLGIHTAWDTDAATKAAVFLAQTSDSRGRSVRPDAESFATWVLETLTRRSAEVLLDSTFQDDGLPAAASLPLVQRALDGHQGATQLRIGMDLPVIALGAGASTYYPAVAQLVHAIAIVPEHADVANAIGAVVGQIRIARSVTIIQPTKGQFRVHHPGCPDDFGNLDRAVAMATEQLEIAVAAEATVAGAAALTMRQTWESTTAMVEGKDVFVEGTVTVVGTGRPRLGTVPRT